LVFYAGGENLQFLLMSGRRDSDWPLFCHRFLLGLLWFLLGLLKKKKNYLLQKFAIVQNIHLFRISEDFDLITYFLHISEYFD
jgi:hypothetical protein